ncbi:MAG: glycoside hydrolase family 3 C-terminal domain-containing protein [bacterium]|nr:glycoside hydrolase family 3 C-terminal domain-containing protein [bacterium]
MFDYEIKNISKVRENLAECTLFLKHDDKFPLNGPCKIACYGNGVRKTLKGGTGSGEVNSRSFKSIEEVLTEEKFDIITKDFLDQYDVLYEKAKKKFIKSVKKEAKTHHMNAAAYGMGMVMPEMEYDINLDFSADACVYVLSRICGEGNDRKNIKGDYELTDTEVKQINELNDKYDKFMLVLNVGGPVDLSKVNNAKNILLLSQLGVSTSETLVDIILGRVNPSGKLTTTWSKFSDYNKLDFYDRDETNYNEGIYVGYRYFDSANKKALYPFGFGLSYSTFDIKYTGFKVDKYIVKIKVLVTNTSKVSGKEVVEIYLSKPSNLIDNPYQDLVAFKKTKMLGENESEELEIIFDLCDNSNYYEKTSTYILDSGKYIVRVGNSSTNTKPCLVLLLDEVKELKKVKPLIDKPKFMDEVYQEFNDENLSGIDTFKLDLSSIKLVEQDYSKEVEILDEAKKLSDSNLARMCMGTFREKDNSITAIGSSGRSVAGAAGESRSLEGIKPITMADGPAGLRLARRYYIDKNGVHAIGENGIPESIVELLSPFQKFIFKFLFRSKKKAPKGIEEKYQYATAIPIGVAIAQSFNTDYAYTLGDIVGSEMEMFNIKLWLAPALNIHRSVLCGRNFEYYSEDPLISGVFAKYITLGVQKHKNCGVTIKHFACNNKETNRMCNNSNLSERALREIYLKGFEICIKDAKPESIMSSYNLINGIHASEHPGLMKDYLRNECNYDGLIMTDWTSHRFTGDELKYQVMDIKGVISGGGDIFMPGGKYDLDNLLDGLNKGIVRRTDMEKSASSVIRSSRRLNS